MRKKEETGNSMAKMPLSFLIYGMIGILIGIVLLFLFSLLVAKEILPESMMKILPAVAALIGAFISGLSAARAMGKALLTGLIQAVVNFALLYLTGLLVFMRIKPETVNLYVFLACLAGAVLGGLFAAGKKKGKRRAM